MFRGFLDPNFLPNEPGLGQALHHDLIAPPQGPRLGARARRARGALGALLLRGHGADVGAFH